MLELPWSIDIPFPLLRQVAGFARHPSMNDSEPSKPACRQCAAALDADDNYCRRCGTPTAVGLSLGVSAPAKQPAVWESPWVVLPLLLFVLGPLAFPFLWRSRRFTFVWKCILTLLVTGATVLVVWMTWVAMERTLAPLHKALEMPGF
jgi:hypothetical protein